MASEMTEFLVAHPELQSDASASYSMSPSPVLMLGSSNSTESSSTNSSQALTTTATTTQSTAITTTTPASAVSASAMNPLSPHSLAGASVLDLQLATCRKLRELLHTSTHVLEMIHQRHWIPVLLSWLNLRDRPAVQVEALLALTSIAELCAQQHTLLASNAAATSTTNVVKAAKAAVSAVQGNSWNDAMEAAQKYAAAAAVGQPVVAPGSVPFPPLSFSETLSQEALASVDAHVTNTLAALGANTATNATNTTTNNPNWSLPPAPLFPPNNNNATAAAAHALTNPASNHTTNTNTHSSSDANAWMANTNAINFTSLAPPPGGAHTSVPSNAFVPPPTPVMAHTSLLSTTTGSSSCFPQQLSASAQHLLLRHQDAIPTLISLLSSNNPEVYEQALWILGSIAAGDSPSAAAAAAAASNNGM